MTAYKNNNHYVNVCFMILLSDRNSVQFNYLKNELIKAVFSTELRVTVMRDVYILKTLDYYTLISKHVNS